MITGQEPRIIAQAVWRENEPLPNVGKVDYCGRIRLDDVNGVMYFAEAGSIHINSDQLNEVRKWGWEIDPKFIPLTSEIDKNLIIVYRETFKNPTPPKSKVARGCEKCNSPRSTSPCFKCGSELFEPAKGWTWPRTPPIKPIRDAARTVGYAISTHGSMERDLDLIAIPWRENHVGHEVLAQTIAQAINGRVVDSEMKHAGRWTCNIQMDGWYKLIDLSVAV